MTTPAAGGRHRHPGRAARRLAADGTPLPLRWRVAILCGALALIAAVGWPTGEPTAPRLSAAELAAYGDGGPQPPAQGAWLGAAVYPQDWTHPERTAAVDSFEQRLGRPLNVVHVYLQNNSPVASASTLTWLHDGRTVLLSWNTGDLTSVVTGDRDRTIISIADQIKALRQPILLQPRWEMDRPNLADQVGSPAVYIAAWNRIRTLFAEQQVRNVSWVWCPTAKGFVPGAAQRYPAQAFYPGDAEVDWVCADVYPTGPSQQGNHQSFAELTGPFLSWAAKHDKPVMIGEFGVPISYGDRRGPWLTDAGTYVRAHPQIKALVYYDGPLDPTNAGSHSGDDYWLQGDTKAMQAFVHLAKEPYFGGTP